MHKHKIVIVKKIVDGIMTEIQGQAIKTQWRNAAISLTAIAVVIFLVFFATLETLVSTWWNKPEYNHCLLILPIIVYLIHERREVFHKIAPEPFLWGLIPLLGGGLLWLLGDLADANVVRQFGLVILIQGCLLTILGKRVVLALVFPFFYMIFLIPFGDFLVPALQDFTTVFVIAVLNLLNIPVFAEGVYLSIPAGDFHVAETCAGLRFLVATVALGTLMANVAYKTVGRQVTVVLLSFIVPVIANGFRASGIVLIAHWSDMKYATGADHITFGWIFFAIVLIIFISLAMTFTNRGIHEGYIDFSKKYWATSKAVTGRYFTLSVIIAAVAVGMAPLYGSFIQQRHQTFENYTVALEEGIWGQDVSTVTDWKPYFRGASQTFHNRHGNIASESIDIFVAYYKYQTRDIELIRHGNGVIPQNVWGRIKSRKITADISGSIAPVKEELLQAGNNRRLVWHWYWIDGKIVTSRYKAKLLDAKAKVMAGRLDSAIVALSIPVNNDNIDQKREFLANYAASLPPFGTIVSR